MYTWRLYCRPPFPALLGGHGAGQSHLILQLWGGAHCEETEAPKAEPLTPGSSALVKGKELLLSGLGQRQDFPAVQREALHCLLVPGTQAAFTLCMSLGI